MSYAPALHHRMFGRLVRLAVMLCVACTWAVWDAAHAQDAASLERRVKAAFLIKFADFVTWPENTRADAPLVFGVLGDEALAAELARAAAGRTVNGRSLVVRRLREDESTAGVGILFVAGAGGPRLEQIARATAREPVLLVSERESGLERGSVINFVRVGDHVRFEIALDTAEKRGLKLSSRLLSVAQNVRAGGAGGAGGAP